MVDNSFSPNMLINKILTFNVQTNFFFISSYLMYIFIQMSIMLYLKLKKGCGQ